MGSRFRVGIGIAALVGVQVAALLIYRLVETRREPGATPTTFEYEPVSAPAPAAEVPLEQPDGSLVRLQEYNGDAVLLHFWATWCAPCRTELPALLELAKQGAGERRLTVVLVSVDENWATVRHFFQGEIPSPVVRDGTGRVKAAYEVTTLPETYVVRPGGVLSARIRGSRDWSSAAVRDGMRNLASR